GVFDRDELLAEAELHQRVHGLAVRPLGQFFARDAVGKSRDVDDAFVGVEKLRLAARRPLRFDDERRQGTMRRRQASRETCGPRADDDDVPVAKVIEIEVRLERLHIEVSHGGANGTTGVGARGSRLAARGSGPVRRTGNALTIYTRPRSL